MIYAYGQEPKESRKNRNWSGGCQESGWSFFLWFLLMLSLCIIIMLKYVFIIKSITTLHISISHRQQLIMLLFNHEGKFKSALLPIEITFTKAWGNKIELDRIRRCLKRIEEKIKGSGSTEHFWLKGTQREQGQVCSFNKHLWSTCLAPGQVRGPRNAKKREEAAKWWPTPCLYWIAALKSMKVFQYAVTSAIIEISLGCNRKTRKKKVWEGWGPCRFEGGRRLVWPRGSWGQHGKKMCPVPGGRQELWKDQVYVLGAGQGGQAKVRETAHWEQRGERGWTAHKNEKCTPSVLLFSKE